MSGYVGKRKPERNQLNGSMEYAKYLNSFYYRFDRDDLKERTSLREQVISPLEGEYTLQPNEQEVYNMFRKLKATKAAGPEGLHLRYQNLLNFV